jgi:hypothetical protein
VSASYRELFDRALQQALEENKWQIIRIDHRTPRKPTRRVSVHFRAAPPVLAMDPPLG